MIKYTSSDCQLNGRIRCVLNRILINSRPREYPAACGSTSAHGRRLCPCINMANESDLSITPQAVNRRVTKSLLNSLDALREKLVAEGSDKIRPVLGQEEYHQAFPPVRLLQELRERAAVFVRARLGQSCLQACSARGYANSNYFCLFLRYFMVLFGVLVQCLILANCILITCC